LADFTTLAAYGPGGLIWRTGEISWDGVRVTDVIRNDIKGIAWSSPEQREVEFTVYLETGIHSGGAEPPAHSRLSDQG
jgi:hypothetical protein